MDKMPLPKLDKEMRKEMRKETAKQILEAASLSNTWVGLEAICKARDYVLQHHDAFSNLFQKTFLPTKKALIGETHRRVLMNMMRRCAKITDQAIIRKKVQEWKHGGNVTRYEYKLLTQ